MNNNQVLEQLLALAEEREDIRIMVLNGSLVNPHVSPDRFQDVDVTFFVLDVSSFITDQSWIDRFGEVLIMQTPDESPSQTRYERFAFLVQFAAGHRIDLTVRPVRVVQEAIAEDSLSLVMLDKDDTSGRPVPSDETYRVKRPSAFDYASCWNEFWWVSLYVVKGLRRNQLLYALDHVTIMRDMLRQMMAWDVGYRTGFSSNIGKSGDALVNYLSNQAWQAYLRTYPVADPAAIAAAFETLVEQFCVFSRRVSEKSGNSFRDDESKRIRDAFSTLWTSND
ncbi:MULTISPECIES: aminoglycoside 6-adenylyltransferase [unclassified Exiguobacterium]|uniref:aminoglycoside 6-adenylyltransferase n=1 Tax=unclassified Exiguobacterium TaxID=2644629 RepID=UPI0010393E4E|nr:MULTISPECIES: aminoglycoside 6-adenylyltransferase [unclassified Exiguobacterium]TCI48587.1 adenylyltransferase [Exiguobacterium sp. SH5S32]TCI55473.1 adenylyltransferase [Exiguobacterium sp. SH1S4]TCI75269.1 adenylyltransferase [Exiguobacterium sp. SH1S1]